MALVYRVLGFLCRTCKRPAFYLRRRPGPGEALTLADLFVHPGLADQPDPKHCQHCGKDPRWPDDEAMHILYPAEKVEEYQFPGGLEIPDAVAQPAGPVPDERPEGAP